MDTTQKWNALVGQQLSGEFTIKNPNYRVARNSSHYLTFDIKTDLLPVRVIAWEKSYANLSKIWHGQNVNLEGFWEQFNGYWQIKCLSISYTNTQEEQILNAKIRLRTLIAWMPDEKLKGFIVRVLNDKEIAQAFLESPASLNHHHAFLGGLLVHSVDVAWQIFNSYRIPSQERYLGTVVGLFHDLGKTRTLSNDMRRTELGVLVGHDQLTLEILSPYLKWLDDEDEKLSVALRNLLSWKPKSFDRIPKFEVYEVIQMADRVSAGSASIK